MNFLKITVLLIASTLSSAPAFAGDTPIKFGNVTFLPRWAENGQHEFTPKGQEDLEHWTDMITMVILSNVKDGEGLAAAANAVLDQYKNNGASIVKTGSIPKTEEKPAEHLIIVFFKRPDLVEAVFARFVFVDKTALAFIYSHREYGKDAGVQMNDWQKANGVPIENLLMSLKEIPLPAMDKN